MTQLFMDARVRGHDTYVAYVNAPIQERRQRAAGKDIDRFEAKYASSFQQSLPELKHMADHFVIINNSGSLTELGENVLPLATKITESRS
jgi:dephospho-CoA kinase